MITCKSITTNRYKFSSNTRLKIEFNVGNDECFGRFDTSCSSDPFGELSKNCEYLQIIEYIDKYNNFCYGDVPKRIPNINILKKHIGIRKQNVVIVQMDDEEIKKVKKNVFGLVTDDKI